MRILGVKECFCIDFSIRAIPAPQPGFDQRTHVEPIQDFQRDLNGTFENSIHLFTCMVALLVRFSILPVATPHLY